ncbi:MAG: low molecular weight protein arginine phosphatase [Gemmatimonadales bacterium]|nr:MAG: low molecular weight protein arginine phosphatase [Gemmatimonadales bacterium]
MMPLPPGTDMDRNEQDDKPFNLLFVCTGNTCRSPMAEALARSLARRRGLDRMTVKSAGVAALPGMEAAGGAVRAAERRGLKLHDHRSRPLDPELATWADLILTMSPNHLPAVVATGGGDRVAVITSFIGSLAGPDEEHEGRGLPSTGVPDPFGGPDELYELTMDELERLVDQVLDRLAPVVEEEETDS